MNSMLNERASSKQINKYKIYIKVQINTRIMPVIQKSIIIKNHLLKRFINAEDLGTKKYVIDIFQKNQNKL